MGDRKRKGQEGRGVLKVYSESIRGLKWMIIECVDCISLQRIVME